MIRFGILGAARIVARGLLQPARDMSDVALVAIASRNPDRAREFASRQGIPRVLSSYQDLIEDSEIDAVYVALPTGLHYEWARRALANGKHVLCEKPLASTATLAADLASCAQERQRVLMEGMHIRHMRKLRRQKDLVSSGELGRLVRVEACFRFPWIPMGRNDFRVDADLGGGAGLDLGCYAVSSVRHVVGEEPEVTGATCRRIRPDVDRWMRASMRFPSGSLAVVESGFRGAYFPRFGVDVYCEEGSIKWSSEGLTLNVRGRNVQERFPADWTYKLQLEQFVEAVVGESSVAPFLNDAIATARVVDSMYAKAGLKPRGASFSYD